MRLELRKRFVLAFITALFLSRCEWPDRQLQGVDPLQSPLPTAVRFIYEELGNKLREIELYIATDWSGRRYQTVFGTELLAVSGHRKEKLLTEQTLSSTRLTLERLKGLGAKAVTLNIEYPILLSSFPRSAEYLDFYKGVVAEVKKRNLVLIVEIGTMVNDLVFSPLTAHDHGITLERFKKELLEMAHIICQELHPDYLTLLNEPDRQSKNTGLNLHVGSYTETIQFVLNGLDRHETRVGAGAGTWERFEYFKSLSTETAVDYLDMHIYPVQRDFVIDKCLRIAALARQHNKRLGIGKAWLYKAAERELEQIPPAAAFGRDVFNFWEPRDVQFVDMIFKLSHYLQVEYCCFSWMRYFYGYVEFNEKTRQLPPEELLKLADELAARNMASNRLTRTGLTLQQRLVTR